MAHQRYKRARAAFPASRRMAYVARRVTVSGGRTNARSYAARGAPAFQRPISISKSVDLGGPKTQALDTGAVPTAARFQLLNGTQVGAGFFNRIGQRVTNKSLHMVGTVTPSGQAGVGAEYHRIMIIYDRQPNGAFPVLADVLADFDNAGASTTNAWSHLNYQNRDRFMVLMDIRNDIPNDQAVAINGQAQAVIDYNRNEFNVNRFINLKGVETMYKASTGAIGDIATGAIFLMTIGTAAAAAAGYNFVFNNRLRYDDC